MLAVLRKVTSFEYVIGGLAILTVVLWRDPLAQLDAGRDISHFFALQSVGTLVVIAIGSRALFRRDPVHFDVGQWLLGIPAAGLTIGLLAGLHVGAGAMRSVRLAALGWVAVALLALLFALPKLENRPSANYPRGRRLCLMGGLAAACVVAAIITALLPMPSYGPAESPYRAWFPREAG